MKPAPVAPPFALVYEADGRYRVVRYAGHHTAQKPAIGSIAVYVPAESPGAEPVPLDPPGEAP